MGDRNRDNPDNLTADLPEVDSDVRSDIEQAVEENQGGVTPAQDGDETPLEPSGTPDGNSGTGGNVKNQDDLAQ